MFYLLLDVSGAFFQPCVRCLLRVRCRPRRGKFKERHPEFNFIVCMPRKSEVNMSALSKAVCINWEFKESFLLSGARVIDNLLNVFWVWNRAFILTAASTGLAHRISTKTRQHMDGQHCEWRIATESDVVHTRLRPQGSQHRHPTRVSFITRAAACHLKVHSLILLSAITYKFQKSKQHSESARNKAAGETENV